MSYLICHSYFSWLVLTHVHMVCIHVIHMCQYTNPLITLSFICLHDDYDISQYYYIRTITMTSVDLHDTTALSLACDSLAQVRAHDMPPGWRASHLSAGRLCPAPS